MRSVRSLPNTRRRCMRVPRVGFFSSQFVRFFNIASNETSVYPVHSDSDVLCPSATLRDLMRMMEREQHTSLPLDSVDVLTAGGHIVDPSEPVAGYAQSCVGFSFGISVHKSVSEHLYSVCYRTCTEAFNNVKKYDRREGKEWKRMNEVYRGKLTLQKSILNTVQLLGYDSVLRWLLKVEATRICRSSSARLFHAFWCAYREWLLAKTCKGTWNVKVSLPSAQSSVPKKQLFPSQKSLSCCYIQTVYHSQHVQYQAWQFQGAAVRKKMGVASSPKCVEWTHIVSEEHEPMTWVWLGAEPSAGSTGQPLIRGRELCTLKMKICQRKKQICAVLCIYFSN